MCEEQMWTGVVRLRALSVAQESEVRSLAVSSAATIRTILGAGGPLGWFFVYLNEKTIISRPPPPDSVTW